MDDTSLLVETIEFKVFSPGLEWKDTETFKKMVYEANTASDLINRAYRYATWLANREGSLVRWNFQESPDKGYFAEPKRKQQ